MHNNKNNKTKQANGPNAFTHAKLSIASVNVAARAMNMCPASMTNMEVQLVNAVDVRCRLTGTHKGECGVWNRLVVSPTQVGTSHVAGLPVNARL